MRKALLSGIRSRISGLAVAGLCTAVGVAGFSTSAAAIAFDQNITPNVIFGSGVTNGGWTVEQASNVEVGLRAKVRFDDAGSPQNIFNSAGNGMYFHQFGQHNNNGRAKWSFEWSINVDLDGTSFRTLDDSDLTYTLRMDSDPGVGATFFEFDPIKDVTCADHATGTNATGEGGGATRSCSLIPTAGEIAVYDADISAANVAQNSWQLNFFTSVLPFDPDVVGIYDFELEVAGPDVGVVTTSIQVKVLPEPGSLAILGLGLAGLGVLRRRRKA